MTDRSLICNQVDWYVAAATPRKERFAIANLQGQGFPTFFPLLQPHSVPKAFAGRPPSPLFPGYIFVGVNPRTMRWQSINGTFGIRYLVGPRGSLPSAVPSVVMEEIFNRFPEGALRKSDSNFEHGQKVEVITGPFAGIPAKFEEMLSQDRIRVLLSWLNTELSVVMPTHSIVTAA